MLSARDAVLHKTFKELLQQLAFHPYLRAGAT